ncbi:MAG: hypothetical protein IK062_08670 [Selenomonadaceae bacterium]|nr:hypothetical protein [Selenomonadaceae bacterium]
MYEYVEDVISTLKVSVNKNRDGNICQEGDSVAGQENFTFKGFASSITAAETVNDENSPALHNGISGLVWLLSGTDENFEPTTVIKTTKEAIENE